MLVAFLTYKSPILLMLCFISFEGVSPQKKHLRINLEPLQHLENPGVTHYN